MRAMPWSTTYTCQCYLQAGYSFARIENALSFVVTSMETFSGLATGTDRLFSLFTALHLEPPPGPSRGHSLLATLLLIPPPSSAAASGKDKGTPTARETRVDVKHSRSASGVGEDEESLLVASDDGGAGAAGSGGVMRTPLDADAAEGVLLRITQLHVRAPSIRRRGLADLGVVPGVAAGAWEKGYLVADELSLTLTAGMTVMLMGPSGCGKSSLLRVIAGLWTHGRGEISCVEGKVRPGASESLCSP